MVGEDTSITTNQNGRLAVSYFDAANLDLKLWLDDGAGMGGIAGDGLANGSEVRTIDSTDLVGQFTSITVDQNDRLAVSYVDHTNADLKLWIDDGAGMGGVAGDGLANGGEVRSIETDGLIQHTSMTVDQTGRLAISYFGAGFELRLAVIQNYEPRAIDTTGAVGQYTSITLDQSSRLAVSYYDAANNHLKLWIDDGAGGGVAGDGLANGTEAKTIDSSGNGGTYSSITLDQNGRLAVSYYASGAFPSLKLWVDDGDGAGIAGDGIENGSEVRTVDPAGNPGQYSSITVDQNGRLAISYYEAINGDLQLWIDDGDAGGTAGDGQANGSEIRTIDSTGNVGSHTSITVNQSGRLAVSYLDTSSTDLKLWLDDGAGMGTAGDGKANGSEIRTIDSTGNVGYFTSITVEQAGHLAVSYWDSTNSDLKLWVDDGNGMGGIAGDGLANGSEVRTLDSTDSVGYDTSIAVDQNGRLAVSYFDLTNSALKLWIDDGVGGGMAGDGFANGSELRTAESTNIVGQYSSITLDRSGRLAVSYYDGSNSDLRLFYAVAPGEIDVFGNSVSIAYGDLSPTTADHTDFDAVATGASLSRTFTISNSGDSQLFLGGSAVSISGANAADFTVTAQSSVTVAPGGTATFTVEFAPTSSGLKSAQISIANNDSNESPYSFAIQGTGAEAEMDLSGNGMSIVYGDDLPSATDGTDFGIVNVGDTNSSTFTVTNSGTGVLNLDGMPEVVIIGSSSFTVTTQPATTLPVSGGTTTFVIQYAPTSIGFETAIVSIDNNDADEAPYTFRVHGLAVDPVDTDGDGIPDSTDPDDDNDGVTDVQEMTDGSNPLDAGSAVPVLPTEFCSEWNSFLGMLNVNEYANAASANRSLDLTFYNLNGVAQSMTGTSVLASSQRDVLVHDLTGFAPNSYGRTCTDVTNGAPGDVDGRTIWYHPAGTGFDFAISLPFFSGKIGNQFVPFNTYHPSFGSPNFVANWISVTNDSSSSETGTLTYYAQDGSILGSETATIAAGGRKDFSAHQFGPNRVGLAEWGTSSTTAKFVVRNIRYYYDNTTGAPSFNSAMQVEGIKATGEEIVVPLDKRNGSAVLELSNAADSPITVNATFRNSNGTAVSTTTFNLSNYATTHVVADGILTTDIGSVTLQGSFTSSVVAVGVHYSRDTAGELQNVYALSSREALGSVLRSSYNTFLGQSCDLLLVNSTGADITSSITMTRFDGTVVANGVMVTTPASGVTNYNLCANDTADKYGAVVVQPGVADTITGAVVRHGAAESYQFATELRQ